MGVEGSTIVIVGGSSGIGLAAATEARRRGANVVIGGRDEEKLQAAITSIGNVRAIRVDAGDPASLASFYESIGRFDHLVIAASGGRGGGMFASLKENDLRSGFEAKFWVQWRSAQASLDMLSEQGSITFVSAASARASNPGTSGLAAVNGAVNALVGPLARELAPRRVNAVSPGVVDTPWWDAQPEAMKTAFFRASEQNLPVGRVGQPIDLAEAILFLAGNAFTTGVVLDVDGGLRTVNPA
jgi:NAD(P)-dependent dehydrogenase (short-subunit alcohol dehydrogenase family)